MPPGGRLTQIMNLLRLAPDLQVAILRGQLLLGERELKRVYEHAMWDEQRAILSGRYAACTQASSQVGSSTSVP